MSTLSDIKIKQSASSLLTFSPVSHDKTGAVYREDSATNLDAASTISISELPVKAGANVRKARIKITDYYLETITGGTNDGYTAAPRIAGSSKLTMDFEISKRATLAQISALRYKGFYILQWQEVTGVSEGVTQVIDLIDKNKKPW